MIKLKCAKCKKTLTKPGGLLFDPPRSFSEMVCKYHLCVSCYWLVYDFVLDPVKKRKKIK